MASRPLLPPHLALVSGILAVSTGAIFVRLADAPAMVTAAYRVGLAVIVLIPVAWFRTRRELIRLDAKDVMLAMAAGLFLALHFATWIASLGYTSVASSVVLVNTHPIWVGLLTPFVNREPMLRATRWGIVLSVIGGTIVGAGDFSVAGTALYGDGLALAGGICAAFYLLLGRNLRRKLSLLAYIFLCYGSAAILLWAWVLIASLPVTGFSTGTWAAFWAMALVAQLIGHSSYNWALKWFSTGMIAVSLLGEPIGASILAYLLFGETVTAVKLVGCLMILGAIFTAARGEKPA